MRLYHKYIAEITFRKVRTDEIIQSDERLIEGDSCIYCNLFITKDLSKSFDDDSDLLGKYAKLNIDYPCITEEEYIIKSLLE